MEPREEKQKTDVVKHLPLTLVAKRARPRISWTDHAGTHERRLDRRLLVGSSASVHVAIRDRSVSRLHAELEMRDGGVWVRDLGSTNGTWINGVLVQSARVGDGDALRLGERTIRVDYTPAAENVALWPEDHFGDVYGRSEVMRELFVRLAKMVESDAPVLFGGESGSGKGLLAQALHDASPRAAGPFVVVECTGVAEPSLEIELFGDGDRAGAFEDARYGTVLLHEVSDLAPSLQAKVLRVLEDKAKRRPGELGDRPGGARIVASTSRDLRALVATEAFREDLYFALAVLPLEVAPLRERQDDAPDLLARWLPGVAIDDEARNVLRRQRWAGNVRELANFAELARTVGFTRAIAGLAGGVVDVAVRRKAEPRGASGLPLPPIDQPFKVVREAWTDHLEREYIGALLHLHARNIAVVADLAGLDRTYVHRLVRKHRL